VLSVISSGAPYYDGAIEIQAALPVVVVQVPPKTP
jgi:hypothetical protein